ncbi:MAG: hypothetical protein ACFCD0_17345, partial [Gemmataceae bacterium]
MKIPLSEFGPIANPQRMDDIDQLKHDLQNGTLCPDRLVEVLIKVQALFHSTRQELQAAQQQLQAANQRIEQLQQQNADLHNQLGNPTPKV